MDFVWKYIRMCVRTYQCTHFAVASDEFSVYVFFFSLMYLYDNVLCHPFPVHIMLSTLPSLPSLLAFPQDCDMTLHHAEECLSEVQPCHRDKKKKEKSYMSSTLPNLKKIASLDWDGPCK